MNTPSIHPAGTAEDLPDDDPRRWLSALADGDAAAATRACSLWRGDAAARQTWHTYHLIGDVMRSDELARAPERDAAFLARLRAKLAAEPVLLAPVAPVQKTRPRRAWLMPAAAAAGFAVVAGVLVLTRLGQPGVPGPAAVMAGAPGAGLTAVNTAAVPAAPARRDGGFIRDPRLDEYLRAHQSAGGGVAAAAPGGALRRVDVTVPAGASR
jgi:sigma-E factor negative regulatory protein RseA